MTRRPPAAVLLGLLLVLPACGHRGDPRPPLRKTPTQPGGFRLAQRGDAIELRANSPAASVDGLPYESVAIEFLHLGGQADLEKTGTRELVRAKPGTPVVATIPLPAPGTLLRAAARSHAGGEKSARTLTQALVVQPPLEAPRELSAHVAEDGVALSWQGVRPKAIPPPPLPGRSPVTAAGQVVPKAATEPTLGKSAAAAKPAAGTPATAETKEGGKPEETKKEARTNGFLVYRRVGGAVYAGPLRAEPLELRNYRDLKAPLGARSCYVVRAVGSTSPLIESAPSNEVCVTMRDITPPAAPVGLTVMPREGGLELLWSPSGEEDLAGYRVYRTPAGGKPERLAEVPPSSTSHLDSTVRKGAAYSYSISAVDGAGNESETTEPVSAALP